MAQGSVDPTVKQWLIKVDQNLSLEGFFLLKALYLNDIPLAMLADRVCKPHDLCLAQRNDNGEELLKISPHHSVSLFIHRLRVLVPSRRTELRHEKDVGAQACLDSLPRNLSVASRSPGGVATKESKLLECLIKTYVNLSPQQRIILMRNMSESLGGGESSTVFQIFQKFFSSYKNRPEAGIAHFSSALQAANSPAALAELEESLTNFGIPHYKIPIPDGDGFKADHNGSQEQQPLISRTITIRRGPGKRGRNVACVCLCLAVPVAIGVILLAIGMGAVHAQIPQSQENSTFDISNFVQPICPYSDEYINKPVRLGHFSTFWQEMIEVEFIEMYSTLILYPEVKVYLIPNDDLQINTKSYQCRCDIIGECSDFGMADWYLIKGSSFNFSITFSNSYSTEGYLNMTICNGYSRYFANTCSVNFTASTFSTNTLIGKYTVPNDGYYFMASDSQDVYIDTYELWITEKSITIGDSWTDEQELIYYNDYQVTLFKNDHVKQVLKGTGYTIVGYIDLVDENTLRGIMNVTQSRQTLVYAVPALSASVFIAVGLILATAILLCYYGVGKIIERRHTRGGSELLTIQ